MAETIELKVEVEGRYIIVTMRARPFGHPISSLLSRRDWYHLIT